MRRTKILNANDVKRTTFDEAVNAFFKHCKLKNLRSSTINYYSEDLTYFHAKTDVKYVDEVSQEVIDAFILKEMETGKKTSSVNSRIRGLRVFLSFCAERKYLKPVTLKLMKTDKEIKEPYTEAELRRLLEKPKSNRWTEWRNWAVINYLISTGNRVGTVVNLRNEDINFDEIRNLATNKVLSFWLPVFGTISLRFQIMLIRTSIRNYFIRKTYIVKILLPLSFQKCQCVHCFYHSKKHKKQLCSGKRCDTIKMPRNCIFATHKWVCCFYHSVKTHALFWHTFCGCEKLRGSKWSRCVFRAWLRLRPRIFLF